MSSRPSPAGPSSTASPELERAYQQAVLDNLPALVAYWDRDLRNRFANKAYVEFFGRTPEQLRGLHISELLGPDLYARNLPYLQAALAGERQEFDREIPTPSGPRYTQAQYIPDVEEGHDGEPAKVRGIFVLVTDISARRRAELLLSHAETRFRTLFESVPSATLMSDGHGRIVSANAAAARLFGYDVAALVGMPVAELIYPDDVSDARQIRREMLDGERAHYAEERRYRHADGHTIWAQADVTVVRGAGPDDDAAYLLAQLQDVSERKRHEQELDRLAHHDPLTGVLNRRGLTRAMEQQAARAAGAPLGAPRGAMLVCDLDRFKQVNDELGHAAGDQLLVTVARVLESAAAASAGSEPGQAGEDAVVGRLGGDEFAVVLPGADLGQAQATCARIARRLDAAMTTGPWAALRVTASLGAAEFDAGLSGEEVLRAADHAMYDTKSRRARQRGGTS